jgi:UDPglucose--hexose-1-phosphate uridylyltransferase
MLDFSEDPHRRYNILTGEWVLVSPHRTKRPWQGKVEPAAADNTPSYDFTCYLCPGNERAGGFRNPEYRDTFVFTNDFAALLPNSGNGEITKGLLKAKGERGICRVVCFSPNHSLTLPGMSVASIEKVISLWIEQYLELGAKDFINHVQIFENKGDIMGCSNPHPHGQIWAQESVPGEAALKGIQQSKYFAANRRSLLGDYLAQELEEGIRIITENQDFVSLVPFWAVWPYEAMIIPRRHMQHIGQLTEKEKNSFAAMLKDLTMRFDCIFETSFPYTSGIHQSPTDGNEHPEWHFHMAFYPPLLRSATVKKFMVGYEMFGEAQRDITAEQAAERLRTVNASAAYD